MLLLGINEGINSSIAILDKGRVVFALQEERMIREKNYTGFPKQALRFALKYLGLNSKDFKYVCLSNINSPNFTRAEFLKAYDATADRSAGHLMEEDVRTLLKRGVHLLPQSVQHIVKSFSPNGTKNIDDKLIEFGFDLRNVVRCQHHFLHAATAYYGLRQHVSDPHLVMTLDGGGDHVCSQVYLAKDGKLNLVAETKAGHSIGNLYSRVTHLMGMTPHEHEYKLMGLAAYRENDQYVQWAVDKFKSYLNLSPDNPLTFQCTVPELTYSIQPRLAHDFRRVRFDNLAAGLQFYTEDLLVRWVRAAMEATGIRRVVCAGGVFMNVKANKRIAELPELEYFGVFPSCGDETLPFGSVWACYANAVPTRGEDIVFDTFCLGPSPSFDLEVAQQSNKGRLRFETLSDPGETIATLLSEGKVVARCSGPMEFGARALGNRSILADASDLRIVPVINRMIKQRDFWMPFAPAILSEYASTYLQIPASLLSAHVSPYMMHTFDTVGRREHILAGIHAYDLTARAQIVTRTINPDFHRILSAFARRTGKHGILNTSFNLHGFPIVTGAQDAIDVMLKSSLNYLVIEDQLVTKV